MFTPPGIIAWIDRQNTVPLMSAVSPQLETCKGADMIILFPMSTALVWFRLDLRLMDNPALAAASAQGKGIVPVFIWAPEEEGDWPPGAASRWWLHHSLHSLENDLRRQGMRLIFRRGSSLDALRSLVRECGADSVFWNRRYEPSLRKRDDSVQQALLSEGIRVKTFNSALLIEPDQIKNQKGKPYLVFTPFWRKALSAMPDFISEPAPTQQTTISIPSLSLDEFKLEPDIDWAGGLRSIWHPGETGAHEMLQRFLAGTLDDYAEDRNFPAIIGTSRLSPHLHFGEISPRQVWMASMKRRNISSRAFLRQLGWREFAHHLLFHFPDTDHVPLRPRFAKFPWQHNAQRLQAWQRGCTGYPMVDAGMRELWMTGWMHNRVRMITGSFLVKDLLLSWQEGSRWFWDTLVDADLANNTLGWQWIAGCGADAAPYFRIFNPTVQAAKYDADGHYVRRWIPEANTPDYPSQIVSHEQACERALEALATISKSFG
jgi:deoxyribodipyrimidine photo-lyase